MKNKKVKLPSLTVSILILGLIGSITTILVAFMSWGNRMIPSKIFEHGVGAVERIKEENKDVFEQTEQAPANTLRAADETDHIWGEVNAPVQLILYDDFAGPFSAGLANTIKEIKEELGETLAVVFRHFPVKSRLNAMPAALASECAAEQGKFWEMHDKIFTDNELQRMSIEQFKQNAIDLNIDTAVFNECLDTEKYKDKIVEQKLGGGEIWVTGTPTFFVNGEFYVGAYPYEDFTRSNGEKEAGLKSIIERQLENSKQ